MLSLEPGAGFGFFCAFLLCVWLLGKAEGWDRQTETCDGDREHAKAQEWHRSSLIPSKCKEEILVGWLFWGRGVVVVLWPGRCFLLWISLSSGEVSAGQRWKSFLGSWGQRWAAADTWAKWAFFFLSFPALEQWDAEVTGWASSSWCYCPSSRRWGAAFPAQVKSSFQSSSIECAYGNIGSSLCSADLFRFPLSLK